MKRILVVDDEESIRITMSAAIARQGYHLLTAQSGRQALSILREDDVSVAFVDVRMPEMDGIELTRAVVSEEIPVTIIVMSAYGSVDNAIEAMKAGAYDYITKPFKADEIVLTLAKAEERENLRRENARLKAEMVEKSTTSGIIARSGEMASVLKMISKVSEFKSTVLITGESGTGKELVAQAIHSQSSRAGAPFVAVNCGAIPETLLESELFGYRRGAFTDARADKTGLFAEAEGGTIFLDEIGELPGALQVKLLRVLQENTIRPIGDTKDSPIDVRVIAATAKVLEREVADGRFREDLFYRLHVLPIHLPALRDRPDDIVLLVEHFIKKTNERLGTTIAGITEDAERLLCAFAWPGNVRQLENAIERAVVLCDGRRIGAEDLPDSLRASQDPIALQLGSGELSVKKTMRIIEEELIRRALGHTKGNRTAAAKLLEISHRALLYKIKEYGVS